MVSAMDAGGAETFLMKVYRNIDKSKFQMDFLCASLKEGFYEKEILSLGGKIYHIEPKNKGFIKNFTSTYKIVKENKYNHVLKTSQQSLAAIDLLAAKFAGARTRVFRSSNAGLVNPTFKDKILQNIFSFLPKHIANVRIAPSTEAAEYVFGKDCIKKGKAQILHNGLDLAYYSFSTEGRNRIRKELNIEDKLVIGHIGRFNKQKNHSFLIDIFNEIHKINNNAVLLLVGDGELKDEVINKVEKLELSNNIFFLGVRKDIPDILSAMDIFVFPSYFEGMPNAIIEAQATGLSCLISDSITSEAIINDNVKALSLNEKALKWANNVSTFDAYNRPKQDKLINAGYDISRVSEKFGKIIYGEND